MKFSFHSCDIDFDIKHRSIHFPYTSNVNHQKIYFQIIMLDEREFRLSNEYLLMNTVHCVANYTFI